MFLTSSLFHYFFFLISTISPFAYGLSQLPVLDDLYLKKICPIRLPGGSDHPELLLCDPDKTLQTHDVMVLTAHMRTCHSKLANKTEEIRVTILIFNNISIAEEDIFDIDNFMHRLTRQWYSNSTDKEYIALVEKENNQIREWYSDELNKSVSYQVTGGSLAERLGDTDPNFINTVFTVQLEVCEIIESMFSKAEIFNLPSMLWIVLSVVLIVGSVAFGCWIYRFNKDHPTDTETEVYEMDQDMFYDDEGLPVPSTSSGFVLSKVDIEAASHDPARVTTHEALNQI